MSFATPTIDTLIARIRADLNGRLPGADSRVRRNYLDGIARMHAGAVRGLYGMLADNAAQVMPDTADDDHLDRWATIWGVSRKAATIAVGSVTATGLDGAIVPAGSILQRADGTAFVVPAATAIAGGAATLAVVASAAGAIGNSDVGTALAFSSPSTGIGAAATVATGGLAGGEDEESDTLLLARLLARIQTPPQGGSSADYLAWTLAQPEVTRAWIYPGWVGAGSVGVAVVMDGREDIFPTSNDLDAIAATIDVLRPVTANVVLFAPTPYQIDFRVRLTPDTTATRAAVQAEMTDLFAREAAPGGTLLISHIREAIAVALGVTDYDLQIPGADVIAEPGFFPVPGNWVWVD